MPRGVRAAAWTAISARCRSAQQGDERMGDAHVTGIAALAPQSRGLRGRRPPGFVYGHAGAGKFWRCAQISPR